MRLFRLSLVLLIAFTFSIANIFAVSSNDLLNKKITLDAEDASISHIMKTMAAQSGCNIVMASDIQGSEKKDNEPKLTIHLNEVPVEQAIQLVVKSIGLSYRLIGEKTFLVGDKKKIEEEIGERSYIINLNYAQAKKVAEVMKEMPGTITALESQNSLLVRANPESFTEISNRIQEIDTPTKQIEVRARIIEINVNEAKQYGIDWQKLNHLTTIIAENPKNTLGEGLPYNFTGGDDGVVPGYGEQTTLSTLPEEQYWQKIDGFSDVGHFSRQLTAFDITIDWLLQNNAGQILTDTRVTAMNGEEAEIHIGETIPYVARETAETYNTEEVDAGIILKIKPHVNLDGKITTKIEPEVSSVIELVNGNIPRVKKRKVISTVTIPEGEKIIVGGLLSTQINKKVNKVPFLGDLAYVGKFFRHTYEIVETTDLIIEITPTIVNSIDTKWDIDERLERKLIKEK